MALVLRYFHLDPKATTSSSSITTTLNLMNTSISNNTRAIEDKLNAITGKSLSSNDFTDYYKDKLRGIEEGAEVNVQADWDENDSTADSYIKNKPIIDTVVTENSDNLITSGAVYTAIDNLPEPMIFKGSLGTGGTILSLPSASSSNKGYTYKVITDDTYNGLTAKAGDVFISDGTTWVYIPSADEPNGTVTNVAVTVPTGLEVSGSPITTSGTLAITYAIGYAIPTLTDQAAWTAKQDAISDLATIRSRADEGHTAYGWGDHSQAGYLTGITKAMVTTALGYTPPQLDTNNYGVDLTANVANYASYYPALYNSTSGTNIGLSTTDNFDFRISPGFARIYIGENSGRRGLLDLHDGEGGVHTILPPSTGGSDLSQTLPDASGVLLNDANYRTYVRTLTGAVTIRGASESDAYSLGGFNRNYASIILKGDATYGISGIVFESIKADGITHDQSINNPSDVAFIQYHPYGVTASSYNVTPTEATSGEKSRLVIGIGNDTGSDSGEELWLLTAGSTDLKHYVVDTGHTIWDDGNDGSGSGLDADLLDGQHGSYYAAASSLSNYLPLSGGTLTGALTVKQYIFGYNYNHAGNNAPAFVFDKPGSNYTGIGANGEADTIYFSAATLSNGEASWVTSYKQKWMFNGTVKADSFVKNGGTSSQFLKADGSVDSNTYLPLSGGTMTGTIVTPGDDNKGIEPAKNNYGQVGSSSKYFYRSYINNMYGTVKGSFSGGNVTGGDASFYNYKCRNNAGFLIDSYGTFYFNSDGGTSGAWGIINNKNSNSHYAFRIDSNDNATLAGTLTLNSDIRLKRIIEDCNIDVESIANAPLFKFRWKNRDDNNNYIGTSAQYWKELIPELVQESNDESNTLSLQYGTLGVVNSISIAKEVVELKEEIKLLQALIAELKLLLK